MPGRRHSEDLGGVARLLQGYAERGVFRSFSEADRRGGKTTFNVLWHHGRVFRLVVDTTAQTISFPALLPEVPAGSPMFKELKVYLHQFETKAVPGHRRVDPTKASLRVTRRGGNVAVTLIVKRKQYEYCTRRLVNLAHEVFLIFLPDGPYYEYRVQKLGVDPELVWS
jgi:hypothetical protein